ncbi:hypothetical protein O9929_05920 [Vibrio lentus]|nr:hypothetical protein [Vibrio lentus]
MELRRVKVIAKIALTEPRWMLTNWLKRSNLQQVVKTRATVLGRGPRGGRPTAFDRVLASRMGN